MTPLACLACGRDAPCPDCRHHNKIPGWDEPTLPERGLVRRRRDAPNTALPYEKPTT